MPTEKPRVTVTMSQEQLDKIDSFRFDNKMKNQTQAILALIESGLSELAGIAPSIKTAPSLSDEAMKIAKSYEDLDDHGKRMIRVIITEEQRRIDKESSKVAHLPPVVAARDGKRAELPSVDPISIPDDDPLP